MNFLVAVALLFPQAYAHEEPDAPKLASKNFKAELDGIYCPAAPSRAGGKIAIEAPEPIVDSYVDPLLDWNTIIDITVDYCTTSFQLIEADGWMPVTVEVDGALDTIWSADPGSQQWEDALLTVTDAILANALVEDDVALEASALAEAGFALEE